MTIKKIIVDCLPFPSCILQCKESNYINLVANLSFCKTFGFDPTNVEGSRLFENEGGRLFDGREEIIRKCLDHVRIKKTPASLTLYNVEENIEHADPSIIWLFEMSILNLEEKGDFLLLTFHNITKVLSDDKKADYHHEYDANIGQHVFKSQTKQLKAQVHRSEVQFNAAVEELDNFVYSVSHDLRAPLRRIDGFSQELINEYVGQLDETATHYLRRIRQGAQDMGKLIDDLLKLSRISKQKIEREPIDIGNLSTLVFQELIELEPERNATFKVSGHGYTTSADLGLTKVLLTNLISNALKFSSKKEKSIIEFGQNNINGDILFFIKDNGVGFDPDHSDKLFKAFSRLHTQNDFKGTGIGLATVKRIVSLHGGKISAESSPDEGAIFYFNFNKTE